MTQQLIYECDECGKKGESHEFSNWIATQLFGNDATLMGERPIDGEFCSDERVVNYFRKRRG